MEDGRLQITVVSANDLKYVNFFSEMDVYVVVSINGDSRSKQTTPVHRKGGTSPSWNSPMEFTFNNAAAQLNQLTLSLKIRCERVLGDKDIGEVCVPIKDLLQQAGGSNGMLLVTLPVKRPSGRHKGNLTFSYKFGHPSAYPSAPERQAPGLPDTPDAPVPGAPDVGNPPPPPVAVPSAPVWANPPPPVAVPSAPAWANPPPPPPPPPPYTYAPLPWHTPAAQPPDRTYRLQPLVQQAHLALTAGGLFLGPSTGAGDWADDDFGLGLLGL